MLFLWYHYDIMNERTTQTDRRGTSIPTDSYDRLAKLAETDRRSMTAELGWLVDREYAARFPQEQGTPELVTAQR